MKKMKNLLLLITLVAGVIAFALPAQATKITYGLDVQFGADDPQGSIPWITATFDDAVLGLDLGKVRLTVTNNLVVAEYNDSLYFNFNDLLNVTFLSFTPFDSTGSTPTSITKDKNNLRPDGDGYFDFRFDYPNENRSGDRLTSGETVAFDISYIPGGTSTPINAYDFYYTSSPGPGGSPGPFYAAAKIGGIDITNNGVVDEDGSAWIGCEGGLVEEGDPVPEPATMLLLGSGLIGIAFGGKKRFKKTNE